MVGVGVRVGGWLYGGGQVFWWVSLLVVWRGRARPHACSRVGTPGVGVSLLVEGGFRYNRRDIGAHLGSGFSLR